MGEIVVYHLFRLKRVEVAISGLDEATKLVSELELKLAASDSMPSDLDTLRQVSASTTIIVLFCQVPRV
jgi:hypothetical protein